MNPQFIFLTQSVAGAVTEIILLLIGAALIGFLTAWFYQKSVYTPVIEKLEAEKEELISKVNGLNIEISDLKKKISDLEKSIGEKDKEIAELKKPKK
jgi:peptidoglycan hydrolase CwlO-like protein